MEKKELNKKGYGILDLKKAYGNGNITIQKVILKELENYKLTKDEIKEFEKLSLERILELLIEDKRFVKNNQDYIDEFSDEIVNSLEVDLKRVTLKKTDKTIIVLKKIGLSRNDLKMIGIKDEDDFFLKNFLDKIIRKTLEKELEKYRNKKILKNISISNVYHSEKYANLYNIDISIILKKSEIFNRKKDNLLKEITLVMNDLEYKNEEILSVFNRSLM